MYGICYIIQYPCDNGPEIQSIESFESFKKAVDRSKEIMNEFFEDYGEDEFGTEYPDKNNPKAVMSNGEVTGYVFIKEILRK